nr:unnamed protein product [Callosobruchus chinensis]
MDRSGIKSILLFIRCTGGKELFKHEHLQPDTKSKFPILDSQCGQLRRPFDHCSDSIFEEIHCGKISSFKNTIFSSRTVSQMS